MKNKESFEIFNKMALNIFPGILKNSAVMKQFGIQKPLTDNDIAQALRSPIESMIKGAFNELQALVELKEEIKQIQFRISELVIKIEGHLRALSEKKDNSHPSRAYIASLIAEEEKERKLLEDIKKQLENHSLPKAELQFQVKCYLNDKMESEIKYLFVTKKSMSVLYTLPEFENRMNQIIRKVPSIEEFQSRTGFKETTPHLIQAKIMTTCSIELFSLLKDSLLHLYENKIITKENFSQFSELDNAVKGGRVADFIAKYQKDIDEKFGDHIRAHHELGSEKIESSVMNLIDKAKPFITSNHQHSSAGNNTPDDTEPDPSSLKK